MATIFPKNFASNSFTGSVVIRNGHANVILPTNPYALEGNKQFVVRLRKNSTSGFIVATSPQMTIVDTSTVVSLSANVSSVAEGNLVSFTLVTANAMNGAGIFYSAYPVTANLTISDFLGGNTGVFPIVNNQATFVLRANTDAGLVDETGEKFGVQIRTNSAVGDIVYSSSNVEILDFYKTVNVISFVENYTEIAEGSNVTFTITAHNANATTLYYYTSGNVLPSNFVSGNTGSFIISTGTPVVVNLPTTTIIPNNVSQSFQLNLSQTGVGGVAIATSNVVSIVDTALAFINATGGNVTVANGYTSHRFTDSNTFNITNLGIVANRTIEYLAVAGGGAGGVGSPPSYAGAGGGGAGGMLTGTYTATNTGISNIIIGGGANGLTFSGAAARGDNGSNTTIASPHISILAFGGGSAGYTYTTPNPIAFWNGGSGGSGGAAGYNPFASPTGSAGSGVPGQGNPGGSYSDSALEAGGGGGAGAAGESGSPSQVPAGSFSAAGGAGATTPFTSGEYFAGGGGAGAYYNSNDGERYLGLGGTGGGGNGGGIFPGDPNGSNRAAQSGGTNTGGGGGGGRSFGIVPSGSGGSGIVIVRYRTS